MKLCTAQVVHILGSVEKDEIADKISEQILIHRNPLLTVHRSINYEFGMSGYCMLRDAKVAHCPDQGKGHMCQSKTNPYRGSCKLKRQ